MTAKEYLTQAYRLDQRINSKLEQVAALNSIATKATATLTGMPRSPNHATATMADAVDKIVDLQAEINHDIDCLVDLKREIAKVIKAIDNHEYQMVLEKRYISNKTWPEIAKDLGYHLRHLYRMHEEALKKVIIPEVVTE